MGIGNGPPSVTGTLRATLGTIVAVSAAPYGYTVTLWSSGAVLWAGALHWLAVGVAVGAVALHADPSR
jgi:hypothetical protein